MKIKLLVEQGEEIVTAVQKIIIIKKNKNNTPTPRFYGVHKQQSSRLVLHKPYANCHCRQVVTLLVKDESTCAWYLFSSENIMQ